MLKITVPAREFWDDVKEEFINIEEQTLELEHSLVSLSKWESKWHKPFLTQDNKTTEEIIDYVRCMTLTENVEPLVYEVLTNENMKQVYDYLEDPMTATTFSRPSKGGSTGEFTTNETIYQQMVALSVPFECENWHLNRLMTLLRVCAEKSQPDKKMSKRDAMNQTRALNKARRAKYGAKGR